MTNTINESDLSHLPVVTVTGTGRTDGEYPFVHVPTGSIVQGVIVSTNDTLRMWEINDGVTRAHPALAPYAGLYGWWVQESEVVGGYPPAPEPALPGQDFSDVPEEHRDTIPSGARWGTVTGSEGSRLGRVMGDGRYLAVNHDGVDVLCFWPGHPKFADAITRVEFGVPLPWRGFRVAQSAIDRGSVFTPDPVPEPTVEPAADFTVDQRVEVFGWGADIWNGPATVRGVDDHGVSVHSDGYDHDGYFARQYLRPLVEDRLAEVPEEHRHLIPDGARWGHTTSVIDNVSGRFLAVDPTVEGGRANPVLITWPGHPDFEMMGNREPDVPLPLHGWCTYGGDFEFDEEPTPESTPEPDAPIAVGDRVRVTDDSDEPSNNGKFAVVRQVRERQEMKYCVRYEAGQDASVDYDWWVVGVERVEPVTLTSEHATTALQAEVADLQRQLEQAQALVDERERERDDLNTRLATARQERDTISSHYSADLDTIGRVMHTEAVERDWCGEYEQVMRRINGQINAEIENYERNVEVCVDISGTVQVPWNASLTVELPANYDGEDVDRAVREWLRNTYVSELSPDFRTGDIDWDTSDDDSVEVTNYETN